MSWTQSRIKRLLVEYAEGQSLAVIAAGLELSTAAVEQKLWRLRQRDDRRVKHAEGLRQAFDAVEARP